MGRLDSRLERIEAALTPEADPRPLVLVGSDMEAIERQREEWRLEHGGREPPPASLVIIRGTKERPA